MRKSRKGTVSGAVPFFHRSAKTFAKWLAVLITVFFLIAPPFAPTGFCSSKPFLRVIVPNGGEVWREGETHEIIWESSGVKRVYISVGVGGKDKGLIGDDQCKIDTKHGRVSWTIPKGFVTGFGISRADDAKVLIFDSDRPEIQDFSDGYFTIEGTKQRPPEKIRSELPGSNSYTAAVRSYFNTLAMKKYKQAYEMLGRCKLVLYDASGSAIAFQPRPKYEAWLKDQHNFRIVRIKYIRRVDSHDKIDGGSATALLGIHLYEVTLAVKTLNRKASALAAEKTLFVYVVRGTDGKIRILGTGTGP